MFINLIMSCFLICFSFCRTSDRFCNEIDFILKKSEISHTYLIHTEYGDELNWKRRHKRRKKAINRTPRRGK